MRRTSRATVVCLLAIVTALALAQTSSAVGPSLPALDGGAGISAAKRRRQLRRAAARATRPGCRRARTGARSERRRCTAAGASSSRRSTGALTGLSPNGRVLVLSDNVQSSGSLRARSRFAVVDTRTLALEQEITLRGDFSVDALSPERRSALPHPPCLSGGHDEVPGAGVRPASRPAAARRDRRQEPGRLGHGRLSRSPAPRPSTAAGSTRSTARTTTTRSSTRSTRSTTRPSASACLRSGRPTTRGSRTLASSSPPASSRSRRRAARPDSC